MSTTTKARHIECTLEKYHSRSEWCRSQVSEDLRKSPPLFYGWHVAKPPLFPRKTTKDLDVGTVAHAALTSPASLDGVVAVIPDEVLNADGHRKGNPWKEWSAEHGDRVQLKAAEVAPIRQMIRNVYAHPRAAWLLERAMHYEFTLLYEDQPTGLQLRARPDLVVGYRGKVVLVDFKTTRSLTPADFSWQCYEYGYHRQLAWYRGALEAFGYDVAASLCITVDKSPAHECRVYELPDSAVELGHDQNRVLLDDLARRLDEDDWIHPLGREAITVDLPNRAYREGVTCA